MARARFGTDGIRGRAGTELTVELAYALGRAVAEVLDPKRLVVGRDTRESGPLLAAALVAGATSLGVAVADVGVLPTPGIAFLCEDVSACGAVVSASHNPFADNGIKVLGPGGTKLDDEVEAALEAAIDRHLGGDVPALEPAPLLLADVDARAAYIEHLVGALRPGALDGMRICVDCANGAASGLAERLFERLGASVVVVGAAPDGRNINDGVGSTHPEGLAAAVVAHGADLGLALDGDADRLIAVDETGGIVDGDALLCLFAADLDAAGRLGGGIVVTVMSNVGLHRAMAAAGIDVHVVGVGDRNVLVGLDDAGLVLGGEQSGHLIFKEFATTGDGLLSGLLLADLVRRSGSTLSRLADGALELFPQVLVAVPGVAAAELGDATQLWEAIAAHEAALGDDGRILVRASGTEPVVRVMVEASSHATATAVADDLCRLVTEHLGVEPEGGPVT
jgi:phosphoglucosamine mutase